MTVTTDTRTRATAAAMRIERYYYLTALPALGELGSEPPIGYAELLEQVGADSPWGALAGTLFLSDDLLLREAFLAGEVDEVDPAVLTVQQVRNAAPLPSFLVASETAETAATVEADSLWEAYYRHAASVARRFRNTFLLAWVAFEVGLRNALAAARAKRLGLEEAGYVVAGDLAGESPEDFSATVSEWTSAATPLDGLRVVLRARWAWIARHDAWFSFSEDELLAYAARLMLLDQWRRTTRDAKAAAGEAAQL
ncbi:MAG: DUF2764 family protein [Planctomycetaceae bacterium]|nr:DUF2764 family protein [Planctomycetaceae bacterium]